MSITIDYYFNHSEDLPELAKNLNAWLGCNLSPYDGDSEDLFCRFLAMEFTLCKHDLGNDGELDFDSYIYQLGFRTPVPDGDLRIIQLPSIALSAYSLYRRMNITGMLVYNVQILLARYEERLKAESNAPDIYDSVSAQFVSFPGHFETLQNRIPNGMF